MLVNRVIYCNWGIPYSSLFFFFMLAKDLKFVSSNNLFHFTLPKKKKRKKEKKKKKKDGIKVAYQIWGLWRRNLVQILWLLYHLAILSHSKVETLLVEFYNSFFFFRCTMLIITYLGIYIYTFWWMKEKGIYYYHIAYTNRQIVSLLPSIYSMILGSTWKMEVKRDR